MLDERAAGEFQPPFLQNIQSLRTPGYNSCCRMFFPPLDKFRISFHVIGNHRLIIFNAHNVFIIRCDIDAQVIIDDVKGARNINYLRAGRVKAPGAFLVLADGILNKARTPFSYVHGTRFYYKSPTSYNSGSPFDTHREQSVNVGWLDGHVSLADEGTLRRNFINDDTIFVSEL